MKLFQTIRRHFRIIIVLLIVFLIFYHLFFSNYGFIRKWELEKQKQNLLIEIRHQIEFRDSLKNRIKLLTNDTTEIEKIAREKYGLLREGEVLYVIGKKKAK